ncbi:response regulator [Aristophania vespae]|uniref:Response regulator n=1 Tax=Aristophania vespae TaxID=2697033 RepID=A0A6P1NFB3_9PROT|nr:response regulator transcription factor [Aristophania vespae]QHI95250.1 response regulator [Aristophania vespae]UMM64498.1 Cell cycle response regulator CtrA [Aristophania vespae]
MRVLIAESDLSSANQLTKLLSNASYTTERTSTGEEAMDMLRHYDYDLFITELNLTDMDAADLIRMARRSQINVPIIVVSAVGRRPVKTKILNLGADDYVVKPFDPEELVARCQAIMRRTRGFADSLLRVGPLELNLESRIVSIHGKPLHLTGKEYAILELLVIRKNTVLTKDTFLNHLYGGIDEPEMKIIDVFICKLRRKLQTYDVDNLISTVWGRGYIMRDVTENTSTNTNASIPALQPHS